MYVKFGDSQCDQCTVDVHISGSMHAGYLVWFGLYMVIPCGPFLSQRRLEAEEGGGEGGREGGRGAGRREEERGRGGRGEGGRGSEGKRGGREREGGEDEGRKMVVS